MSLSQHFHILNKRLIKSSLRNRCQRVSVKHVHMPQFQPTMNCLVFNLRYKMAAHVTLCFHRLQFSVQHNHPRYTDQQTVCPETFSQSAHTLSSSVMTETDAPCPHWKTSQTPTTFPDCSHPGHHVVALWQVLKVIKILDH